MTLAALRLLLIQQQEKREKTPAKEGLAVCREREERTRTKTEVQVEEEEEVEEVSGRGCLFRALAERRRQQNGRF